MWKEYEFRYSKITVDWKQPLWYRIIDCLYRVAHYKLTLQRGENDENC